MRRLELIMKEMSLSLAILACGLFIATAAEAAPKRVIHAPQADVQEQDMEAADADPLEPLNRGIYQFNYAFDTVLLRPVTAGYRTVMPEQGRKMVSNAVSNLYAPVVFFNSVLQLDGENSLATLWRFLINSTFGVAGLFDAASAVGLENRVTDLGETFAIYGADAGPYVVLPIIGPSNVRDAFGRLGDMFMNPISYADDEIFYSVLGVTMIDARSRNMQLLDDIYANSLDPYATLRSSFMQHRAQAVKQAKKKRKSSVSAATAAPAAAK